MKKEFKGKTIKGKWIVGSLVVLDDEHTFIVPSFVGASTLSCAEIVAMTMVYVEPKTVCQFTGMVDKNNAKIYEHDIVKLSWVDENAEVLFLQQELGFVYNFKSSDTRMGHRTQGVGYEHDSFAEVIGNVFDNKEKL